MTRYIIAFFLLLAPQAILFSEPAPPTHEPIAIALSAEEQPSTNVAPPTQDSDPKKLTIEQRSARLESTLANPPEDEPGAPRIPTAAEREAIDEDPDNTAGFSSTTASILDSAKSIEQPEASKQSDLISPEESAQRIAALEQARQAALAAAETVEEEKLKDAKKRENIFETNLTGLKEAGVDLTKQGIACTGRLNIWNDQYARLTFAATTEGILAQAYMNKLSIGPLEISGVGPDGQYGTEDDGVLVELKLNKDKQRITVSGMIELLGTLARVDMIIGTDAYTFFSIVKVLNSYEMKFLAESRGAGDDLDFVVMAAAKQDFLQFLESLAGTALESVTDAAVGGIEKLQKELEKIKHSIRVLKTEQKNLRQQFSKKEKTYNDKTRHSERILAPLRKNIKNLEAQVGKLKKEIWTIRKQLVAARKKALSGLQFAKDNVNKLTAEVDRAKRALKKAKSRATWYRPWMYAVVAAQAIRLAAVEASRWTAVKALDSLMSLIKVWPIDATPPLPALWAAYGSAYASLKSAHASLKAAQMASNPTAMKEYAELIALGAAISANQIAILGLQGKLLAAQASLDATKKTVSTAGKTAATVATKAASVAGDLAPLRITGAAIQFSIRETLNGVLPKLTIMSKIFGQSKSAELQIDLTKPEQFALDFPKMFVKMVAPGSSDTDIIADIESARLKYKDSFDKIEQQKKAAEQNKSAWEQKDVERKNQVARIEQDAQRTMEESLTKYKVTKNEGIYGTKLDLKKEEENFKKPYDEFDPKHPTTYLVSQRFNAYRWTPEWKLPEADKGCIIFSADAQRDIQIGFQSSSDAPSNERLFDLVLGTDNNQGTLLRDKHGKIIAQSRDTEACLDVGNATDFEMKSYWINYHLGYIACGRGTNPGKNVMFEWQIEQPPENVQFFSFSCHDNRIQFGNIKAIPGYVGTFGQRYSAFEGFNNFLWPQAFTFQNQDSGTITFKAKASRDLIIGLTNDTSHPHGRLLARIGMDDNTRSAIVSVDAAGKQYEHLSVTEDRDAVVQGSGTDYHQYWLTYHDNFLLIGRGDNPAENVILEAPVPHPPGGINRFSFSCWDNNIEIRDIKITNAIPVATGTRYSAVNQKEVNHYRDAWMLPVAGRGTITWDAKGNSDMIVALHTSNQATPHNHTYQAVIGAQENSRTLIRDATQKVLASTNDPDGIITETDNYNSYWLTYEAGSTNRAGHIAIGKGPVPGTNIILEHEGATEPITHFSFSNKEGFVSFSGIESTALVPIPRGSQHTAHIKNGVFDWRPEWKFSNPDRGGVILFHARAHNNIMVGLSKNNAGDPEYKIILGGQDNTESHILENNHKRVHTSEVITDPHNFYPYWIWYDRIGKKLRCGRGLDPAQEEIMSAELPDAPLLTSFAFSSSNAPILYKEIGAYDRKSSQLEHRIKTQQNNYHALAEQGLFHWKKKWKLPENDAGTIIFSARAQSDVHVGLHTTDSAGPRKKSFDVIIGGSNNSETIIRDTKKVLARSTDPDALIRAPGNYATYWLSYYKGHIRLGRGTKSGENTILESYDRKARKGIRYFALSNNTTPVHYTNITTTPAKRSALFTTYSAAHANGTFVWPDQWKLSDLERGAFTFEAKAQRDITLGIARDQKSGPLYIVTVGSGNNTYSAITKGQLANKSETPDARITNPDNYNPYWLLYDRGYIAVGHGSTIGEDLITEWQDPRPALLGQFISFSGANNQVSYRNINTAPIPKGSHRRFKHFTATALNKNYTYRDAWKLPSEGGAITFHAKGAENIRIGLHSHKGTNTRTFSYEVAIGAHGNTETHIKNKSGSIVARSTSSNASIMLPDEVVSYWVTYKKGRIAVGTGKKPGDDIIVSWKDPVKKTNIRYFSFSSGEHEIKYSDVKVSEYVEAKQAPRYTATNRKGQYKIRNHWQLHERNSGSITTTVQGEKHAMIGLFKGNQGAPVYDIIIGANNNMNTVLRKNGTQVTAIDEKIKDFSPHPYWLSMHDGVITFGRGTQVGKETLLTWQDPEPTPVRYFGFSNDERDIIFDKISTAPAYVIERDSFHRAQDQQGRMTWNNEQWQLPPNRTLTLQANAPQSDMRIGLRSLGGGPALYTVRLGGWRNTKCALMKGDTIIAELDKTLKLGIKKIWITNMYDRSKRELRLVVGTGDPGHKILLDTTITDVATPLRFFGLSNGSGTVTYSHFALQDPVTEKRAEATPSSASPLPASTQETAQKQNDLVIDESIDPFAIDDDTLVTLQPATA